MNPIHVGTVLSRRPDRKTLSAVLFISILATTVYASPLAGLGASFLHGVMDNPSVASEPLGDRQQGDDRTADTLSTTVQLSETQWQAAGIKLQPATRGAFSTKLEVTGKVSLNQDRVAHIYPMVDGAVESVSVGLGETVKADQLLAVIHSREIGDVKLTLYQARLQLQLAQTKAQIQTDITENVGALLQALRADMPIEKVESSFRNRPMGNYRERVLAAYSSYLKSAADVLRLTSVSGSGAVPGKQLLAAEANRNADLAVYQSRLEQIEYELQTATLSSSQTVKEAETRIAVATTNLRILGCEPDEFDAIDPAKQGEAISHYSIRAPFEGTVLSKDVVLREQVRPDKMLLSIADLSTVWITADIYQEHIPLLSSLSDRTILIRSEAWPDHPFEARVFYTGDIMDETTRTIAMRAVADNRQRLLKPGMFVTVELPGVSETDVLQVPRSAIQEHAGRKFVFVHSGGDQFRRCDVQIDSNSAGDATVMILDGLQAGAAVVARGGFILKSRMLADLMGED